MNGAEADCVDNNTAYESLQDAWEACRRIDSCSIVMEYFGDAMFYLRRSSDPVRSDSDSVSYTHSCDTVGRDYRDADNAFCPYELEAEFGEATVIYGMNPRVVRGRSFLEVAAVDGRNCFHAEWLGATDVRCVDYHLWGGREELDTEITAWSHSNFVRAFKLEHCLRRSAVHATRVNVYDLSPEVLGGQYDVVRAFGLLYHVKHPVLAMQALSSVTRQALVVETEVFEQQVPAPEGYGRPDLALCQWFRGDELHNDRTNFFACNRQTWSAWFQEVGFETAFEVLRMPGACKTTGRIIYVALKPGATLSSKDFFDFNV